MVIGSEVSVKTNKSIQSFSLLALEKFCSKQLYEVEYITPVTLYDYDLLNQVVDVGKKFEYLTDVHFVTYEDVLELVNRLASNSENVMIPVHLKETLEDFFLYISTQVRQMESIPIDILSIMTKLKIIETMYKSYTSQVISMERQRELCDELSNLIKEPVQPAEKRGKKGKGKKGGEKNEKKSKKDKSSKSEGSKGKSKLKKDTSKPLAAIGDYTEITLQENEVIFDYDIDNHVQYIILSGFPDIFIFKELSTLNVTVSSIIEITQESSDSNELTHFVSELHNLYATPKISRFFENTALMKYKSAKDTRSFKRILEELLYVIKKINYVKRQHLCYIRHLELYPFGDIPKKLDLDCLEKYNRIMNGYPSELVNIPLILDALVEEICWRDLGPIYSLTDLSVSSADTDLGNEIKYSENVAFQVHEEDYLTLGLHCYKEIGHEAYEKTLKYLQLLPPLDLEKMKDDLKVEIRDRAISTEEDCYCTNIKDYFDFFHAAIFSQMKNANFQPKAPTDYDFTSVLVVHDETREYKKALPQKIGPVSFTPAVKTENDVISNYQLKEDLSTSVLRQMIFKALLDYSCWDYKYCKETGAVLLKFHDNLDDFGIETKIWNQTLRTPVCLRDFCYYIATEERQWLERHKLKEHADLNEDEIEEKCYGLKDILVPELYQEYQYLLEDTGGVPTGEKKRIFDDILDELVKYPRSDVLTSYCGFPDDKSGTFTAYNLGPRRVQLTGHTTIFRSDDGVKVTIDSSRFVTDDEKCSLKIEADENSLLYHTADPAGFHVILADESLIRFSKLDPEARFVENYVDPEENEHEGVTISSKEDEINQEEQETKMNSQIFNSDDYWVQVLRKHKLPAIFPDFFNKINISERKINLDDTQLNALLEVFKTAVYLQHPIYKITTKPSPHRLERVKSPTNFPLIGIVKRAMFKPPRKKKKMRGYTVVFGNTVQKQPLAYDFCINLPNGLMITTLPRQKDLVEIKQSYKYCKTSEEYRVFYTTGVILIKNLNGTTIIYRSNGDIIELTDESEIHGVNCPKNVTDIFSKNEEDICPYELSRCDSPVVTDEADFFALYEFGDIPYKRKTLLEFNGKKKTVFEGKVTETQEYYVLNENDYHSEETFFEREDGLRCLIDGKGKRVVEFPDGTRIIALPKTEKELISVSKNPKIEGWVSVIINYKFEHPKYIPVLYDAFEKSTQLFLKDGMIKNKKDSFIMNIPENIAIEVTTDNIIFLKTCPECDGDCICKIDLRKQSPNSQLLEVFDSYNKYLSCTRKGYCEINSKYITGPKNQNDCDHRWIHEDKKMVILNSKNDPPGTILWKNGLVEKKISECKFRKVKFSNYMNRLTKKQNMEFFTEVQQNFSGRFTKSQSYQNKICLSKYKHLIQPSRLFYVTFRLLIEFQNLDNTGDILDSVKDFLKNNVGDISPELCEAITKMLSYVSQHKKLEDDRCSYKVTIQATQESMQSSSSKSIDLDTLTVHEIISKWKEACSRYRYLIRNEIFPSYFHSEYYHYILSTLDTT